MHHMSTQNSIRRRDENGSMKSGGGHDGACRRRGEIQQEKWGCENAVVSDREVRWREEGGQLDVLARVRRYICTE
jgi:hypothetical protein